MKYDFFLIIFATFLRQVTNDITTNALVVKTFGPPDILEIRRIPIPQIREGQILVKVKAAAICSIEELAENNGNIKQIIPGKEMSGIVQQTGSSVTTFAEGDQVFCKIAGGAYAEHVKANSSDCYKLPNNVTFKQGAALHDYFSAYKALIITGNTKKNETILIHGATGNFGIAAIQVAKAVGDTCVVAAVEDLVIRETMKTVGADYVVHQNTRHYLERTLNKIRRSGFDVILEIPTKANLRRKHNCLAPSGRIIVFGNYVPMTASEDDIKQCGGSIRRFRRDEYKKEEYDEAASFIFDNIQNNGIINPVISREYNMDEATKAHIDIVNERAARGKLVFVF